MPAKDLPCKTQLLKTVADRYYLHLVQWQKCIYISYTEKYKVTDCKHLLLLKQRIIKTSEQIAFTQSDGDKQHVKIGLHQYDIR